QGVKLHTTIISMEEPEIMDIELRGNICQIMVKFVSEQINFIKNKAGEIIDGSKSHIEHVTDVWTFERNLKSKEPSWIIVGTQEA
ncbi:MAG: calcium-binding protein, partial [Alphaproteobacteria bacterium CG11_big_fil_rev_8_21_14_0_20_44_7]